ncbi:hypothetical protein CLU79DRAFT_769334 [Phycomyces nitens]|nr:hypothetical protein CLU79DRAFT_769334 [Phycomyces nitens]
MVNIGIIGVGLVGTELVRQLQDANNPYLTVVGIASSRHMLLAKSVPREWKAILKESLPLDLSAFVEHLVRLPGHSVVVDCTASFEIASLYATWLRLGLSVSTPNKKAFAGPVDSYHEMCSLAVNKNPSLGGSVPLLFHESTVGAGMPVLSTLESLVKTGDTILSIEGTFSGTLSYLFNHYSSSDQRFSDILVKARYLGYTEPDPREDLSGIDVARKVT